jgi:hypothetical protein
MRHRRKGYCVSARAWVICEVNCRQYTASGALREGRNRAWTLLDMGVREQPSARSVESLTRIVRARPLRPPDIMLRTALSAVAVLAAVGMWSSSPREAVPEGHCSRTYRRSYASVYTTALEGIERSGREAMATVSSTKRLDSINLIDVSTPITCRRAWPRVLDKSQKALR